MANVRRRQFPGPKRFTEWGSFIIDIRAVSLGNSTSLGNQSTGAVASERLTIVRMRGGGFVHLDAGAALDSMEVGLGLIVVPEEVAIAGVASAPTPLTDLDAPWLWVEVFQLGPAVSGTDDGGDISRNFRFEIDSKAMRKFRTDEELLFVAESAILAGSPTADVQAGVRALFKLT